ncbi:MAG: pectate lyase, partial [Prevotella sp.]|nr:pectate lyase [Prevotella sp.]
MKNIFLIITLCCLFNITIKADSYWKNKFALGQTEEWYGSDEAVRTAENVLLYQRNSGGWPKNIEMHEELTP